MTWIARHIERPENKLQQRLYALSSYRIHLKNFLKYSHRKHYPLFALGNGKTNISFTEQQKRPRKKINASAVFIIISLSLSLSLPAWKLMFFVLLLFINSVNPTLIRTQRATEEAPRCEFFIPCFWAPIKPVFRRVYVPIQFWLWA